MVCASINQFKALHMRWNRKLLHHGCNCELAEMISTPRRKSFWHTFSSFRYTLGVTPLLGGRAVCLLLSSSSSSLIYH
jgi:hypothetical protein